MKRSGIETAKLTTGLKAIPNTGKGLEDEANAPLKPVCSSAPMPPITDNIAQIGMLDVITERPRLIAGVMPS